MIKTLLKRVREYKVASLLSPLFVSLEVVLECLIPFVMAKVIDENTGNLNPIIKYGSISFLNKNLNSNLLKFKIVIS